MESHPVLLARRITSGVGATVGKKDSIKAIFDMAKAGIVTDSTGNKAFQVGCTCSLFRERIANPALLI